LESLVHALHFRAHTNSKKNRSSSSAYEYTYA
jgi:hypothetical protein